MNKIYENKYLLLYLIAFLMLISVSPLFNIFITCGDDMENFSMVNRKAFEVGTWGAAMYSGRFSYIIVRYFQYIPYLINNDLYYQIVSITPVILCFLMFAKCLALLTNNKSIGLLIFALLGISFQILPSLTIPISWPFYFPFAIFILFSSIFFAIYYKKYNKKQLKYISAVLFFITLLFYELHVLYLFLIVIVFYCYNSSIHKALKDRLIYTIKDSMPFIISVMLYILIYVGFQMIYPGNYDGVKMNFDIVAFFNTIHQLLKFTWPTSVYFNFRYFFLQLSPFYNSYEHNFSYLFLNGSLVAYLKGLLGATVIGYLLKTSSKIDKKLLMYLLISSIFLIYTPQILVAMSLKYQELNLPAYTTTFYSFFGTTMFIALLSVGIYKIPKSIVLRKIFATIIIILTFLIGYITQFTNEQFVIEYSKTTAKLNAIEHFFSSEEYKQLPEYAVIYMNNFNESKSIFTWGDFNIYDLWEAYSMMCSGKSINDITDYEVLKDLIKKTPDVVYDIYIVDIKQTFKTNEILITLSKIKRTEITENYNDIVAHEVTTFYYSPEKTYTLLYAIQNNNASDSTGRIYSYMNVNNNLSETIYMAPLTIVKVKDTNIYISDIIVSDFRK